MKNNIASLISTQLPESVVEKYPVFVEFIKTYYEYVQKKEQAYGVIFDHSMHTDVDRALDENLDQFIRLYAKHIPLLVSYSKRNLVKLFNSIYATKGTEQSYVLLFKLLYGVDITVTYPSQNILRASDGIWKQGKFITLKITYGDVTGLEGKIIDFSNIYGSYEILIDSVVSLGNDEFRFIYFSPKPVVVLSNQLITGYDDAGVIKFVGSVQRSPAKISVISPGADFKVGQIYPMPGSLQDSLFKITSITPTGGISSAELIEFGHFHPDDQVSTISPYKNIPAASSTTIVTEETSVGIFTHTINIVDFVSNIREDILGVVPGGYFVIEYGSITYSGVTLFSQTIQSPDISGIGSVDTPITYVEYLASRATIKLDTDSIGRYPGRYVSNQGFISDPDNSLQDNYYFQTYSYVINSSLNVADYSTMLKNFIHPSGTKFFSSIDKSQSIDVSVDISVDKIEVYRIDIFDSVDVYDIVSKNILLGKTDSVTVPDDIVKNITSIQADSVAVPDDIAKNFTSIQADSVNTTEVYTNQFTLNILESVVDYSDIYAIPGYVSTDYSITHYGAIGGIIITDSTTIS